MSAWVETDRGAVCADCWHGCPRTAHWESCDRDGCQCPCREDAERARQLDDRPTTVLEGLARDMETERHGSIPGRYDPHALTAERFGPRRAA